MPKNKHKYLAFPSVNFIGNLYSSRQMLFLSNSIFSKNSIEQIFLNVKKISFLLDRIFRKQGVIKNYKGQVDIFTCGNLKKFNRRKLEKLKKKEGIYKKSPIF